MSIARNKEFQEAEDRLYNNRNTFWSMSEIVKTANDYATAAVTAERKKWLKVIIRSYQSGIRECRICGGICRSGSVYVKHMDWCPAKETNSGNNNA